MSSVAPAELDAYVDLLRRGDGGRASLRIMRGFEHTPAKRRLYEGVLADDHPVRVLWGADDPALSSPCTARSLAGPPGWTE